MRCLLLFALPWALLGFGCSRREEAVALPEAPAPVASAVKEYAAELLTCRDGVLGTVAPAASAPPPAETAAAPSTSVTAAPSTAVSIGGIASLLAPMGDGGVGFGSIGTMTGSGFGVGPRRARPGVIVGVPSLDRNERARAVANTICSLGLEVRRCHLGAESPAGELEVGLDIEPSGRVAKVDRLGGSITDQAFVSCLRAAIIERNFTPLASGITRYRFTFEASKNPEPVTSAGLAPEIIRRVMMRQAPKLKHCYAKRLAVVPTLAGSVIADLTIGKTGKVESVKVTEGTLVDAPTRACIAEALKPVEFPEPKGGAAVMVKYPLDFKSE